MSFLIRTAFWFSLVLLFLPIWPADESTDAQPVGAIRAISAAQQAVSDISGICDRKPEVCETGREAAHTISVRAAEGARLALDMIEDQKARAPEEIDAEGFRVTPKTAILPTTRPQF